MAALGPCALLVCCLSPSSFGIFSAHLAPSRPCFLAAHTLFLLNITSFFSPNYCQAKILVAKNCENLLQVCIFAHRKGISTLHCCGLA